MRQRGLEQEKTFETFEDKKGNYVSSEADSRRSGVIIKRGGGYNNTSNRVKREKVEYVVKGTP